MTAISRPLRLAEAVGALSLATDLAMGQPLEHGLRTGVLAVRIAQAMSLPAEEQVTVFYTGVLHFAGCTAESEIDARFFGNELSARPQMMSVAFGTRLDLVATATRVAHPDRARLARVAVMTRSAFGGIAEFRKWAGSRVAPKSRTASWPSAPGRGWTRGPLRPAWLSVITRMRAWARHRSGMTRCSPSRARSRWWARNGWMPACRRSPISPT